MSLLTFFIYTARNIHCVRALVCVKEKKNRVSNNIEDNIVSLHKNCANFWFIRHSSMCFYFLLLAFCVRIFFQHHIDGVLRSSFFFLFSRMTRVYLVICFTTDWVIYGDKMTSAHVHMYTFDKERSRKKTTVRKTSESVYIIQAAWVYFWVCGLKVAIFIARKHGT